MAEGPVGGQEVGSQRVRRVLCWGVAGVGLSWLREVKWDKKVSKISTWFTDRGEYWSSIEEMLVWGVSVLIL